ncbi:hypothetical protein JHK85_023156 [Glycine max]|nr:hypothetical protein JHK85_023156 [Glycine max]
MSSSSATAPYNTPPALIAFLLGMLVVCFVVFSIVYMCKYCFSGVINTWASQPIISSSLIRLTPFRSPPRGLDPKLLQVFPTFPYASIKDLSKDQKYDLECAICLLEFEDDNMVRLLTLCCHVFHQDCIDLWLRSHKTCPVCRRHLDSPPNEIEKVVDVNEGVVVTSTSREIHIDVIEGKLDGCGDDDDDDTSGGNKKQEHEHGHENHEVITHQQGGKTFARSHSTGHSIVLIRGDGNKGKNDHEKYTLILPEHVLRERHNNKHNCTRSCVSYKDMAMLVAPLPVAPYSNCGFVQPVSPAGTSSPDHTQK